MRKYYIVFIYELIISFFIGAIPLLITFFINSNTEIVPFLVSLKPSDSHVIYLTCLFALYLTIWFTNKAFLKKSDFTNNIFNSAHRFIYEFGFSIQGIFRALIGAISMAVPLIIFNDGWNGSSTAIISSIIVVAYFLFFSVVLTEIQKNTKPT